ADTVVVLDGKVLGKPRNEKNAREMLKSLSGKTHDVITGVTLSSNSRTVSFSSVTKVHFASLSDAEIDFYIKEYKPLDKAGAYGIQEWIGYIGIKGIEGCYYNVMGLPLQDLYHHLRDFD
ncbi:MAG: Maf family nucleotide pyrophosphatase, partial [Muribaculaceae bacterium]|nr:Maf family nucleotide pyrophosphatase [Muribaculaceae bacterium]